MPDSFFEKLKKGMGIETPPREEIIEEPQKKRAPQRLKTKTPRKEITPAPRELKVKAPEIVEEKIEISQPVVKEEVQEEKEEIREPSPAVSGAMEGKEKWPAFGAEPEGELAIDVYQTETHLVIQSAIAGVKPEFLDISMERDIVAIKGVREKPFEEEGDYFTQECYWGPFSREVILPVEVDPDRAEATMKEGILTIRIPKILREKKRMIKVKA